jgi:hypothetical protein
MGGGDGGGKRVEVCCCCCRFYSAMCFIPCFAASLYLTRWKKVLAQQTTTTTRTMASERARLSRAKYTEDTIWRSVYKAAHLPPCS